jgi:iron complex transport system ATP-binding protein
VTVAVGFANVSASYGAREALSGVTAAFAAGAVTGIVGPNGAGKTTLFRTALGLMPLAGGAIHVLTNRWRSGRERTCARHVYLPQGADTLARHAPTGLARLPAAPRRVCGVRPSRLAIDEALTLRRGPIRGPADWTNCRPESARFCTALATAAPVLAGRPAAYLDPSHQLD